MGTTPNTFNPSELVGMSPTRIVVSGDGYAVPPSRNHTGLKPVITFVRSDGWTLGAPSCYVDVAFEQWRDHLIGFVQDHQYRPIAEYATGGVTDACRQSSDKGGERPG